MAGERFGRFWAAATISSFGTAVTAVAMPVLVWSSLGRAFALGAIPVLWACGTLGVWTLVALLLAFGAFSVFGFAATQSLLPASGSPRPAGRARGHRDRRGQLRGGCPSQRPARDRRQPAGTDC